MSSSKMLPSSDHVDHRHWQLATLKSSNKGTLKKNTESEEILFKALKIKGTRSKIGLDNRYSSINIAN